MTREELKEHCEKQIENCEMWARCKGEEPHGKVYEEHKLILKLLEQEPRMIDEPLYKSAPTLRNYEDYHDAEQYTKGWNDAMDYIFPESKKARAKEFLKKKFNIIKAESEPHESEKQR